MKSSKRFEYLRNNGTFSEVYSIDNPPPKSSANMSWEELVYDENTNGLALGQRWGLYGNFLPNSIYAVVIVIDNVTTIVTTSNVSKYDPYILVFGFSCGETNYQFGKITLYFESETNMKFESVNGVSYSNSGSWSMMNGKNVFIKGLFRLKIQ